jgi:hypothetical protein
VPAPTANDSPPKVGTRHRRRHTKPQRITPTSHPSKIRTRYEATLHVAAIGEWLRPLTS